MSKPSDRKPSDLTGFVEDIVKEAEYQFENAREAVLKYDERAPIQSRFSQVIVAREAVARGFALAAMAISKGGRPAGNSDYVARKVHTMTSKFSEDVKANYQCDGAKQNGSRGEARRQGYDIAKNEMATMLSDLEKKNALINKVAEWFFPGARRGPAHKDWVKTAEKLVDHLLDEDMVDGLRRLIKVGHGPR